MKDLEKEQALLEAAKQNREKFNELYKYFINNVYRYSYSLLNNQHEAEDVTSRVFLEFYKKLDAFEWKNISLKSWLFQTARNLCYEIYRLPKVEALDETFHIHDEYEITFVDEIMNLELVEEVKKELEKLNPIERELINLRIWEGLGFKEIASLQKSKEDTTKKRFYRSIEKVKKALESKGVKRIIALPFLFTAIKQVGFTPAYAAPIELSAAADTTTKFIKSTTKMSKFSQILTNKFVLASIIGAVGISTVGLGSIMFSKATNSNNNTQPNNVPTPTVAIDTGYTNWEKYSNESYSIEFLYPKGLDVIEERVESCAPTSFPGPCTDVSVRSNDSVLFFRLSNIQENGLPIPDGLVNTNFKPEESIKFLDKSIYQQIIKSDDQKRNLYVFYNDSKSIQVGDLLIQFQIYTREEAKTGNISEESIALAKKILESFQVLPQYPQVSTDGWETYQVNEYNLEFKRPSSWNVAQSRVTNCGANPEGVAGLCATLDITKGDTNLFVALTTVEQGGQLDSFALSEEVLEERSPITVLDNSIPKHLLISEGKTALVYYNNSKSIKSGNLILAFNLQSNAGVNEQDISLLDQAEADKILESFKVTTQSEITSTPTQTAYIEGSLSYPSDSLEGVIACAETLDNVLVKCTDERISDSRFDYGVGYYMNLEPGQYYIYATSSFSNNSKAYYSEFVTCGLEFGCPSHEPIAVEVEAGKSYTDIDPGDWYASSGSN